jgi:hypothetical protein
MDKLGNSPQKLAQGFFNRIKSQGFDNSKSHSRSRTSSPQKDKLNTSKTQANLNVSNGKSLVDRTMTFTKIGVNNQEINNRHDQPLDFSTFSKRNRHIDEHRSVSREGGDLSNKKDADTKYTRDMDIYSNSIRSRNDNIPSNLKLKRHIKQAS